MFIPLICRPCLQDLAVGMHNLLLRMSDLDPSHIWMLHGFSKEANNGGYGGAESSSHIAQRVHLDCHYGIRTKQPYHI